MTLPIPRREFQRTSLAAVTSAALIILLAAAGAASAQPKAGLTPAKPADVQLAVEKGLFFVEHQSMRWWKTRKCTTCHEGHILLVAANVAKSQGVPVDQEKLDFWTERWVMVDRVVEKKDGRTMLGILRLGNELSIGSGADTSPFVLLHRDPGRDASAKRAELWTGVLRNVFTSHQADGRWDRDPKKKPSANPRPLTPYSGREASSSPTLVVDPSSTRPAPSPSTPAHNPCSEISFPVPAPSPPSPRSASGS